MGKIKGRSTAAVLSRRFIFVSMSAVTILLVVIVGVINIVSFVYSQKQTSMMMELLCSAAKPDISDKPHIEKKEHFFVFPPNDDTAMSARFFVAVLNDLGEVIHCELGRISSVTEDEAEKMAFDVYLSRKESGRIGRFAYNVTQNAEGKQSIFFLDVSAQQRQHFMVASVSLGTGVLCWLMTLAIVIVMSGRAIRPIADNIEKQKQFVTNAGHEIKTPLAIIISNTDAMELYNGENKWSKNIRAQAERLSELMKNLLLLARTDECGNIPAAQPICISDMAGELVHQFTEPAKSKHIRLNMQAENRLYANANKEYAYIIYNSLFDNAVKYSIEGEAIDINIKKVGQNVEFEISNICALLPDCDAEKLFDRFYRADTARTQSKGGCGIGLSAARAAARMYGGDVIARYEKNNRIVFIASLPYCQADCS